MTDLLLAFTCVLLAWQNVRHIRLIRELHFRIALLESKKAF